ncbi:reverse transcriptase (RNA-dependent DNApolymerase) [Striga asiatica]|uniref:Reverse transcriptase (RNA-dependent DNApolymerase) n=1 Tax=Striga asiatica TaxID=4170 RepID=A0A5A7R0P6_STRAF|nr:reverse transcriptase (RNA-dependent DNApolymerase) [Striga asiatica]
MPTAGLRQRVPRDRRRTPSATHWGIATPNHATTIATSPTPRLRPRIPLGCRLMPGATCDDSATRQTARARAVATGWDRKDAAAAKQEGRPSVRTAEERRRPGLRTADGGEVTAEAGEKRGVGNEVRPSGGAAPGIAKSRIKQWKKNEGNWEVSEVEKNCECRLRFYEVW